MHEKHHPLDAVTATAGGIMVICDKCPCLNFYSEYGSGTCGISGEFMVGHKYEKIDYFSNSCPLQQIELKDGGVFRPEEV
jgi:hypothetical protein